MKNKTKGNIIKISALCVDVGAPMIATLTQFPIWVDRSSTATMSGLFVLFAFLSAIPLMRQIKAYLKSPSAWSMWCIMFVVFITLRQIIDEMMMICMVGAIANISGAGLYKWGESVSGKPDAVEAEGEE